MRKIWKYIEIFFLCVSIIILLISNSLKFDDSPVMGYDKLIADIIISLLCFILIIILNIKGTAGFNKKGFLKGLILGIPFIVIGLGSVIFSNIGIDIKNIKLISISNTLLFTINMLFIGINEELWMRGLIFNGLTYKYKNSIWKPIIISSLIFGIVHIVNIFFVNPITLIVQIINAMAGGILFATIFIKSKNIYSVIVIHALTDFLSLFLANCFTGCNSALGLEINIFQAIFMVIAGSIPPILISIFLLKDYKVIEE